MRARSKPSGGYYVYKRERGTLVRWVVEHRPGMGQPKEYRVFETRTEAEEYKQKQLRAETELGQADMGLAPLLDRAWAIYKRNASLRMRPGALATYTGSMETHILPALGKVPINAITPLQVKELIDERLHAGTHPKTVKNAVGVLRSVLGEFVEPMGPLRSNPAGIRRGWITVQPTSPQALSREQVQAFLEAARTEPYYGLILFLALTGARLGEAMALRWGDIDLESRHATIRRSVRLGRLAAPKTRFSVRTIDLPKAAVAWLKAEWQRREGEVAGAGHPAPDPRWPADLVFPQEAGGYVNARHLHHVFQRISRRAHISQPVHPHMLRHTWATQALNAGIPLQYVSRALGHHSTAFTASVYATAQPDSRHDDVDRLAGAFGAPSGDPAVPVPDQEALELVTGDDAAPADGDRPEDAAADEPVDGRHVHS